MGKGKRVIRPLKSEADWERYTTIAIDAYPGIQASGGFSRQRFKDRGQQMHADPIITVFGLFEGTVMLGIMRLYDFSMRLHGADFLVGGVGGVGVDLLHKKKRIAFDMMQYFLALYQKKGAALTALYPFRPDFYRQMGFGYGRKMNQYRISPTQLPDGSRENVRALTASDKDALRACYNRCMNGGNGFIALHDSQVESFFSSSNLHKIGYWNDDKIVGYLLFGFEPVPDGNFLRNNIHVRTLIYENVAALRGLLAYLRVQADQIEEVIINTQDEDFHFLLQDPRNGSHHLMPSVWHETNTQGVGIMYRVIDIPRLFVLLADHNFGGQNCTLAINLRDSFWPGCAGTWILEVKNGRAALNSAARPDVAISLDIAEFSSLIVGATTFRQLFGYGLATISDSQYADIVHRLFYTENKPVCHTSF